jgi:DNA processing protein
LKVKDPDKNDMIFQWLALERVPGVGPLAMSRLIAALGDPRSALMASRKSLESIKGLGERVIKSLETYTIDEGKIRQDIEKMSKLGARIVTLWDSDYPNPLKQIHNPPALLFVRGALNQSDHRSLAVVGMRNPSRYGLEMTETISRGLVKEGFTLVSGLARGIDTACHRAALKYGGRTIGVLGCGIDVAYPRENRGLIEDIPEMGGAIITEFRPGSPPHATNFPGRNRIVSGLSQGVLVVEASDRSGSLITAEHALDQNRDVFAVPGNVLNIRSRGPHKLIKQGAGLVENAEDIIQSIDGVRRASTQDMVTPKQTEISFGLSDAGRKVIELLEADPTPMDSICQQVNMAAGPLAALLLELELAGLIRQHPGKMFSKVIK